MFLDEYYKTEQDWRSELADIDMEISKLYEKQYQIGDIILKEEQKELFSML